MTRSYEILNEAQASLEKFSAGTNGFLIGYEDGSKVVVLNAISSAQDQSERVNSVLPAPLKIVGSFGKTTATGLTATISPGAQVQYTAPGGSSVTPTILAESPLKQTHVLVRCIVDFTLEVPASHSTKDVLTAWQGALCSSDTVFLVNGNTLAGKQTLRELGASWDRPVVFSAFTRPDTQAGNMAAPSASIQPCPEDVRWSTVHLDVLCYVPATTTAGKAATDYVSPALKAQLQSVVKELAPTPGGAPRPLRALHFLPPGYTHYITLVYSLSTTCLESDEESLLPLRAALHAALGLPGDRPLLRVANAVDPGSVLSFSKQETSTAADQQKRLRNVHVGVPPSGVKGGTQHLVRGDYDYHHYMQDKFDDSGWGCAYRSLQTLCSWFTAQHYTARAPPGHREIQSTLVSLGDKTGDFVGSKQWIGAIELGYILDSLLGVTSKVITVPSGDQMPSKARELAAHFDTQGTPIMIGGGVLAYTLLGIDYNPDSGECAFLILDPHYTGADEIGKIRSGQWVAWKRLGDKAAAGGELFVPGAFYNLLCPQRPSTV